jgi:hypothetical protein
MFLAANLMPNYQTPSAEAKQYNAFLTFAPVNVLNWPREQHFLRPGRTTRREGQ